MSCLVASTRASPSHDGYSALRSSLQAHERASQLVTTLPSIHCEFRGGRQSRVGLPTRTIARHQCFAGGSHDKVTELSAEGRRARGGEACGRRWRATRRDGLLRWVQEKNSPNIDPSVHKCVDSSIVSERMCLRRCMTRKKGRNWRRVRYNELGLRHPGSTDL